LVSLQDHLLFERFHGKKLSRIVFLDQVDLPKGSPPDDLNNREIIDIDQLRLMVLIRDPVDLKVRPIVNILNLPALLLFPIDADIHVGVCVQTSCAVGSH
jgi:hypothetical protein